MATGSKRLRGKSWQLRVHIEGGRYVARTLPPVRGEAVKESLADRALRALIAEVEDGQHSGEVGTVAELWRRWWKKNSAGWAPGTYDSWESYGRLHILPAIGSMPVSKVTVETVDDLYTDLLAKLSPGSIAKVHTALRLAFATAVRWGWITSSPIDLAEPPRVEHREIDPPPADQVRRLMELAETTNPDFCAFLHVATDTGARRSMVAGLRWHHVDLDAGDLIFATAAVHSRKDRKVVVRETTKTKKGNRVALHWTTVQRLRELRKRCEERTELYGVPWSDRMYVFTTDPEGKVPRRPDKLTQAFSRLRSRAGAGSVRLHDLRHFMATTYLAAGVDRRTVMGRGGWSSLHSLNRYAHFEPAADRAAAERVGDSVFG